MKYSTDKVKNSPPRLVWSGFLKRIIEKFAQTLRIKTAPKTPYLTEKHIETDISSVVIRLPPKRATNRNFFQFFKEYLVILSGQLWQ